MLIIFGRDLDIVNPQEILVEMMAVKFSLSLLGIPLIQG